MTTSINLVYPFEIQSLKNNNEKTKQILSSSTQNPNIPSAPKPISPKPILSQTKKTKQKKSHHLKLSHIATLVKLNEQKNQTNNIRV